MKHNEGAPRYQRMLKCFTHLPQQILTLHGIDNVTEYVLHSLCDEDCLNLSKAAYFIDNPDFDCLKGVAGFDKDAEVYTCDTVLSDPGHFKEHISNCAFNEKVRNIMLPSARRQGNSHEASARHLASLLGINNPRHHTWDVKHDNHGLLIYECGPSDTERIEEELLHGLSILGFCPVS